MSQITGLFFGIINLIWIIGYVLFIILKGAFFGYSQDWAVRHRQNIARGMIRLSNIKVDKKGTIPSSGNYIFISNHRTYMDPVIAAPNIAFIPVVMMEVASWPIFGYGVKMTGVMYVKRDDKSSREAVREAMAQTLEEGKSIIVYPEGGTWAGPTTKLFRPGTFKIAAQTGVPIIPIAVDYKEKSIAWNSDMTFLRHAIHTFSHRPLHAKIAFGKPINGDNAELLLEQTQGWINKELIRMRTEWENE